MANISYDTIYNKIWDVEKYIMRKYGVTRASLAVAPLKWYIGTGRACNDFLHWFLDAKTFVIARILQKEGSDDDIIRMLKAKAGI